MDLQNWKPQAAAHWRKFQPARFRELQQSGKLGDALNAAIEQTYLETRQLEEIGFRPNEAFQMVRRSYLFPRAGALRA